MVGIVEDNFLGTATSLTAVHNHTPDRNIFDLHFQSPHFFGRRTRLALAYSNKSDGSSGDRKSTRLNSSHGYISYAVFCLKKKNPYPHRSQRLARRGPSR